MSEFTVDGFGHHTTDANDTPQSFLIFVGVYVGFCILCIIPWVYLSRSNERAGHQKLIGGCGNGIEPTEGQCTTSLPIGKSFPSASNGVDDDDDPPGQEMVKLMRHNSSTSAASEQQSMKQKENPNSSMDYDHAALPPSTHKYIDTSTNPIKKRNFTPPADDAATSNTSSRSTSQTGSNSPPPQQDATALIRKLPLNSSDIENSNNDEMKADSNTWEQPPPPPPPAIPALGMNNSDDRGSAVPSVASTSRLRAKPKRNNFTNDNFRMNHSYRNKKCKEGGGMIPTGTSTQAVERKAGSKFPLRTWDFSSRMRWNQGQPLTPAESIHRSVRLERQSQMSEEGSQASRRSFASRSGYRAQSTARGRSGAAISDAASKSLVAERVQGEAEFYRQRYRERHLSFRRTASSASGMSLMPPLSPDVLSPEDAADAHDVGTAKRLEDFPNLVRKSRATTSSGIVMDCLLDLAEPDFETRRILELAIPSTFTSMSEPLVQLFLISIISYFVNTDSMVAYVLVILFVRLTTVEISSVLADAESNIVQQALSQGGQDGFIEAGRCLQIALLVEIMIGAIVWILWCLFMEDLIKWLVGSEIMATLAGEYASIIVVDYTLRGVTRMFMLPFHLMGQASFERTVDLGSTVLTVITIATVAVLKKGQLTLETIGYIQVILAVAKTIMKIAYVVLMGWFEPYRAGFMNFDKKLQNTRMLCSFTLQALPLFVGSVIELGEWELLVLVIRCVSGAEAAAWAIMGVIWEVFGAATEGLGEASAVRVSFYLEEYMPFMAQRLANKVFFLASVGALAVTSIFYMIGPNVVIFLTNDPVLQHLLNNLIGMTGLANIAMTFAQTLWSLTGAQNRFSLASGTILMCRWFIMAPVSLICVFAFQWDILSLAGSVAIGYATAALYLARCVFRCDWEALIQDMPADDDELMSLDDQEMDEDDYLEDIEGDDSDNESSLLF